MKMKWRIYVEKLLALSMVMALLTPGAAFAAVQLGDISGHWAEPAIRSMTDAGVIDGCSDGTFKPDAKITRAEFAVLAVKAFHLSGTASSGAEFSDTRDHWAKDAIATAYGAGIIEGYGDSLFGPEDPITREQAAAMVARAKGLTAQGILTFTDAEQISDWARDSVAAAVTGKLVSGCSDGSFKPRDNMSRAEAATIFFNALNKSPAPPNQGTPGDTLKMLDEAGTYGPESGIETIDGDLSISADGVTLQNTVIKGKLTVEASVGDGSVALKNVTVEGDTFIYGGGPNTINFTDSIFQKITVNKANGKIRILLANTSIFTLVFNSAGSVEGAGTIYSLTVTAKGVVIGMTVVNSPNIQPGIYVVVNGHYVYGPASSASTGGPSGNTPGPAVAGSVEFLLKAPFIGSAASNMKVKVNGSYISGFALYKNGALVGNDSNTPGYVSSINSIFADIGSLKAVCNTRDYVDTDSSMGSW